MSDTPRTIANIHDLVEYLGADDVSHLPRRVYKDTACGGSISLLLSDGTTLHNTDVARITPIQRDHVAGFYFHSIVEGSDAEYTGATLTFPITSADVDASLAHMEEWCAGEWDEANSDRCDGCGEVEAQCLCEEMEDGSIFEEE